MQTIFYSSSTSLIHAFDPPLGVTALVGGGGKTTLMLRLARALAKSGARVIVTTTTHIFPPDGINVTNPSSLEEAHKTLQRESLVCFAKPVERGKLSAPDLTFAQMEPLADYILTEADGSRRHSLKAPAEHEPVIPPQTRLVIAVAGLDGVGQLIRDAAFRPALYATLCGKSEEDVVTPRDIALVLSHPQGQRKGLPDSARFAILLNKLDDEERTKTALAVAAELEQYYIERVVIASLGA